MEVTAWRGLFFAILLQEERVQVIWNCSVAELMLAGDVDMLLMMCFACRNGFVPSGSAQ
jgi:hypothetical protein